MIPEEDKFYVIDFENGEYSFKGIGKCLGKAISTEGYEEELYIFEFENGWDIFRAEDIRACTES